ncbi:hypothetical protein [Bythopirellula polymerisocia]|uniref:Mannose-6-phosphate isomerase n=1 Tax=Bythopirellula polymerisocia TaxID=2528003 RepID=A0A5C6D098_9BACT|nr:hypothetical protein [Bythopirellula polymerisocia]TWU28329.1 hypothetical protein Pla144_16170 [Bythopirellula polymerisocia]
MSTEGLANKALDQGQGVVRLTPTWVPRSFCVPGRRIKLHPDDYYALGANRGGIDERWFSSTTPADNGPLTSKNEGLSNIVVEDSGKTELIVLRDAVSELKGKLIGEDLWRDHQCWPMYSKFFDNQGALPFHIHHNDEYAARVNAKGKPEAYYFPPQVNNHGGDFPYTFFGLQPGVTKAQVRETLVNFSKGANRITDLSAAHCLTPGTGWDVPPGILHAPGSLCTYEPQKASDVFAMYESVSHDKVIPEELLWKDTPKDQVGNFDYLVEVIDWEMNVDPNFKANHFMAPIPVADLAQMQDEGYQEKWICYRSEAYSAKELTILPGRQATIKDAGAYGLIVLQGHGKLGVWDIETPSLIRFGQLTHDEYFVSADAAKEGVTLTNPSKTDPIVMLKHFGPGVNAVLSVE